MALLALSFLGVLDDSCAVDTDCSGAMANSFCDGGLCKCQFSYVPLTNNTGCERIKVGDVCTVSPSDECSVAMANSECKGEETVSVSERASG